MSISARGAVETKRKIRNGWLLTFSSEHQDYDYGLCGLKESVAFFDIDDILLTVKKISPDNFEGFKKADLDQLVSWIESREGDHTKIYGNHPYSLAVFRGRIRQEWEAWGKWETLEKSANKTDC